MAEKNSAQTNKQKDRQANRHYEIMNQKQLNGVLFDRAYQ